MMPPVRGVIPGIGALRRIVVFRALHLGDMLCVVPALRALRRAVPHARITLVGLPWAREFADRFRRYLDDFMVFPGFPGLPESVADVAALPRFLVDARRRRFDLAIQLHGSGSLSNPITGLLGARRQAGFHAPGAWCPDPALCLPWGEPEHEVLRYLRLMQWLGCAEGDAALEFPIEDADRSAYLALAPLPPDGQYVCIHPGARLASRRWPAARFGQIADGLAAHGWRVVVTGGAHERAIAAEVMGHMTAPALDLTGRTTLGTLAMVVGRAGLLVSNDTGVSHLAAASGTPSVIVSSGADPLRWAPLDRARHRVLFAPAACRPCAFAVCPIGHPCALDLGVEPVLEAALAQCERSAAAESGVLP